jgi:hypothetical protein
VTWAPWRTADKWGLAQYASTRAEEVLGAIPRPDLVDGPDKRRAVAEAIYHRLQAEHIDYDLEKFDPSEVHQLIRTPSEVLVRPRKGTCLDLALVFSGLALSNDLLPVVVVLDGHALVLLALTHGRRQWDKHRPGLDDFLREPVTDPDRIMKLVEQHAFLPVECTGFARGDGYLSFDDAVAHGTRLLRERRPALVFAVDVQVARAKGFDEWEFTAPSAGPSAAEVDVRVITHERALGQPSVRNQYLRNEKLKFVNPGVDHPTAPGNLWRRLVDGEAGHGVLLVGPAGAGKTRTCHEVAAIADADGWRVLHVHTTKATTAHVREAVLREPSARTVLVLDYLDACQNVLIDELEDLVVRPVEHAGGRLVLLATSRPGRLESLRGRGTDDLFEYCTLRGDPEFLESVTEQIFEDVAPRAHAKLGSRLSEVCGSRPVIALLIARDVERLVRAGQHVTTGPRSNVLIHWLRDRLVRDGVLPKPGSGQDTDDQQTMLAMAFATALTPGPRAEVERLVQRLLDNASVRRSAREMIDELTVMGWTEQVGDALEVAHDVVTDELLLAAVAPIDGLRVLETPLRALLDALVDAPGALDRFAGNVARVHTDLKGAKPDQFERACRDWVRDRAPALGAELARSPEGGHALYTMLHAAPWQKAVSDNWDEVVEPWLSREFGGRDRVEVLAYSLRELPTGQAGPVITRALVWLAGLAEQPNADFVLTYLLRRDDLDEATAAEAARHTLRWLRKIPPGSDPTFVLRGLLQIDFADRELQARVVDAAVRWAADGPLPSQADFVLRHLIRKVQAGGRETVVTAATGWLDEHGSERRATFVLGSLLFRTDLTDAEIADIRARSLDWLARHGGLIEATYLLRQLLGDRDSRYLAGSGAPEVTAHARRWLRLRPTSRAASYLLPGLLKSPHVTDDEARGDLALALAWLDAHADAALDVSYVLRGLVHRVTESDVGEDLTRESLRRVCGWLGSTAPGLEQRFVLLPLLQRIRTYDATTGEIIVALTRRWLLANPANEVTSRVLAAALTSSGFHARAWDELLDFAIGWVRRYSADPRAAHVLRTLLNGMRVGRVDPENGRLIAAQAERWLRRSGTPPEQGPVLALLLTSDAVRPQHRAAVLLAARDWLDANLDHPAAADVLAAVFSLRASAADAEHDEDWGWDPEPVDEAEAEAHRAVDVLVHRWLRVQSEATATAAVLRTMLVASVDPDPVVHAIFGWLVRNADDLDANDLFQALLEQGDRLEGRLLDALPREPTAVPVLAGLIRDHGRDLDALHHAGARAVRWLDEHPDDPVAFFVRQAVLRSKTSEPRHLSPVINSTLDWLAANPTHPWATSTLRTVLAARRMDKDHLLRATEAAFGWLDTAGLKHGAVNNVLQALLRTTLDAEHVARVVDLTTRWLDAFPDHPSCGYVLCALLGTRGLDRAQLSGAADRAAAFVDAAFETRTAASVLYALLNTPTLDHDRLVRTVDRALAWTNLRPDGPAVTRLLNAVLGLRAPMGHTASVLDVVLSWLEGNREHLGFNYVLKAVLQIKGLGVARQQRAVAVVFEELTVAPDGPNSAYLLEALLNANRLPVDLLVASADAALAWLARNGDQGSAPYVLRRLVMKRRLPDEHRAVVFETALEWMDRHFDDHDVRVALTGLLTAKQANPTHQRRAVAWALRWLDDYRGHVRANFVLQDLLQSWVDDPVDRDRMFGETLTWLGAFPDMVATPYLLRKALNSRNIDLAHTPPVVRVALKWLEDNPRYAEANQVLQGLLECASLKDPDLATVAGEVVEAVFAWLRTNPDMHGRGYVVAALCDCAWLPEADQERAVHEASAVLSQPDDLAERCRIAVELVTRADRFVPLALDQVDRLSTRDRAVLFGRLAAHEEAVVPIMDWLGTDEAAYHRAALLPGLLARSNEDEGIRRRLVDLALRTVAEDPGAGEVLSALLLRADLPAGERDMLRRVVPEEGDDAALVQDEAEPGQDPAPGWWQRMKARWSRPSSSADHSSTSR